MLLSGVISSRWERQSAPVRYLSAAQRHDVVGRRARRRCLLEVGQLGDQGVGNACLLTLPWGGWVGVRRLLLSCGAPICLRVSATRG